MHVDGAKAFQAGAGGVFFVQRQGRRELLAAVCLGSFRGSTRATIMALFQDLV